MDAASFHPAVAVIDDLAHAVHERRAILFAGAGLSISIGLPSWRELIGHMAAELDLPEDLVSDSASTYSALAEYYRIRQGSIGPLRSWMDRSWRIPEERIRDSCLHRLVLDLDFPIIYTTNYDRSVEAAYEAAGRPYVKIANGRDIARAREGVPQIVKFHGDFDDDQSLVITETDYFNRLGFDTPLDIKFRSDALGKTVLFVGYSMGDLNIRLLLHRLWRTWSTSGFERERPRSFVFMARHNPVQAAVLAQWGITTLAGEGEEPGAALATFLTGLRDRVRALGEEKGEAKGGA